MFAFISLGIGIEHMRGAETGTAYARFLSALFLSAHTFTTVEYGRITPDDFLANMMAAFQALLGLMAPAVATGLLFGRFSRPVARLDFSRQMVVAPYAGGTSLQFSVANRRTNNLMEIEAQVLMMPGEPSEQVLKRKYRVLTLERTSVLFLPLTWTVLHPIDEASPLCTCLRGGLAGPNGARPGAS